jgi:ABC-type Fe3+/spermidine/putrescine transport system ATPase subunit
VFQDYALFPHMSVEDNVGYGLVVRREPNAEIRRKVRETLEVVGLATLLDRFPSQLSGGQRQRVALARALVCEPRLVLLDEPLAALDAELRRQMQLFLKDLQRRIATTFLFVTHDQEEAITMSDRIVFMARGHVEQVGTPGDIYYAPATAFVARFFGDNNLIAAMVRDGAAETAIGRFPVLSATVTGGPALAAVRPERIALGRREGAAAIACRVEDVIFVGAMTHVRVRPVAAPDQTLLVKVASIRQRNTFVAGDAIAISIDPSDIAVVPVDGAT